MDGQTLEATVISEARVRPRREWWAGAIATLPFWPGAALFGLVYAVTARAAGLSGPEIVGMSLLVHAGSAQFTAVNLIAGGAGSLSVIIGTMIANARYLLIGASVAPYVADRPLWWRLVYAFHLSTTVALPDAGAHLISTDVASRLLHLSSNAIRTLKCCCSISDESYAIATAGFLLGDATSRYALGANLGIVLPWMGSAIVGVIVGAAIPSPTRWGIDLVIPLTFLGLLIPLLKNRRAVGVALCSGLLALLGVTFLPGTWYLVVAGVGGSIIGATWQTWEERRVCS